MIISNSNNSNNFYYDEKGIPRMTTTYKTPRNIKSKHYYIPEPHPARKRIYDFNNIEEYTKDLIDCMVSFNRHTVCKRYCKRNKRGRLACRFSFPMKIRDVSELECF